MYRWLLTFLCLCLPLLGFSAETAASILAQLGVSGATVEGGTSVDGNKLVILDKNGTIHPSLIPFSTPGGTNVTEAALLNRVRYIDPEGVNSITAGSSANPFKTLEYAINNSPDDTIFILSPGAHNGVPNPIFRHDITKISLVATLPDTTWLSGVNPYQLAFANDNDIEVILSGVKVSQIHQLGNAKLDISLYNGAWLSNVTRSYVDTPVSHLTVSTDPLSTFQPVMLTNTTYKLLYSAKDIAFNPETTWTVTPTTVSRALDYLNEYYQLLRIDMEELADIPSLTNIVSVSSSTNYLYYDTTDRLLYYCVTNTPLTDTNIYVKVESDPFFNLWLETNMYPKAEVDPTFTAWLVSNNYIKVESDPIFVSWLDTNTYVKTEMDPYFMSWLSTNVFEVVEDDPIFLDWLSTNTYVKVETDPEFTAWLLNNPMGPEADPYFTNWLAHPNFSSNWLSTLSAEGWQYPTAHISIPGKDYVLTYTSPGQPPKWATVKIPEAEDWLAGLTWANLGASDIHMQAYTLIGASLISGNAVQAHLLTVNSNLHIGGRIYYVGSSNTNYVESNYVGTVGAVLKNVKGNGYAEWAIEDDPVFVSWLTNDYDGGCSAFTNWLAFPEFAPYVPLSAYGGIYTTYLFVDGETITSNMNVAYDLQVGQNLTVIDGLTTLGYLQFRGPDFALSNSVLRNVDGEGNAVWGFEEDPLFTDWLATIDFTSLEIDPVFIDWLATIDFTSLEIDPVFTNWLENATLASLQPDNLELTGYNLSADNLEAKLSFSMDYDAVMYVDGVGIYGAPTFGNAFYYIPDQAQSGSVLYDFSGIGVPEWYDLATLVDDIVDFTEEDPIFTNWLATNTFTGGGGGLTNEVDPLFVAWLGTNTYIKVEKDPLFSAWTNAPALSKDLDMGQQSITNVRSIIFKGDNASLLNVRGIYSQPAYYNIINIHGHFNMQSQDILGVGRLSTKTITIETNSASGRILASDAYGNGVWQDNPFNVWTNAPALGKPLDMQNNIITNVTGITANNMQLLNNPIPGGYIVGDANGNFMWKELVLTTNRTVTLTTSMTDAQRQEAILSQPKILAEGVTLTFLFENGTHHLGTAITIDGFQGGSIILRSAGTTLSAHRNQPATLSGVNNNTHGIVVARCNSQVVIRNLRVLVPAGMTGLTVAAGAQATFAWYCSFSCGDTANSNSKCIRVQNGGSLESTYNVLDNSHYATLVGDTSRFHGGGNIGTNNIYCIRLYQGGWATLISPVPDGTQLTSGGIISGGGVL